MKGSPARIVLTFLLISLFLFSASGAALAAPATPGESVRVWVAYGNGRAAEVRQSLANANATFHYDFADLGAYVVTLPAAALNGIQRNPHVLYVEEDAERYPIADLPSTASLETLATLDVMAQAVPYGIDMVQARDVWDVDRNGVVDAGAPTGAGIKLCIIDSGLYTGHEDFLGVTATGYGGNLPWATDGFGHGTHVAGTIAAMNNALGVVGVTPGAVELYIVRVFGDDGAWAYSSTLVDALNRCTGVGAKVVSMSLGGSRANTTERNAFANAYSAGVLSIAAAGNAGTSAYSYPASYTSVVSVAAIDVNKAVADFSQYNSAVELAAPGVGVLSTLPYADIANVVVDGSTYTGNPVEFAGTGTASGALVDGGLCGTAESWAGKVVLCQRGTYDFNTKVQSVKTGGGVAAVIYNNVAGDLLATLGEGNSATIPAIGVTQEAGAALMTKVDKSATVTNIHTAPASGYAAWDGTSMATPHVSAVAALVWSANPTWTNVQIRNALTSTAEDLGTTGRDVYYGYGLVQAKAALDLLRGVPEPTPVPTEPPTVVPTPLPTNTPVPGVQLVVSVITDKSTYLNGQTVYITTTVTDGTNPVAAAAVTVTVNNDTSGKVIATLTGTTGAEGTMTLKYKLNTRKTGTGKMTVTSTASKTGYDTGSGTTSFMIN